MSRLNSENACYHSMKNLLFFNLLPKNVKIQIANSGVDSRVEN